MFMGFLQKGNYKHAFSCCKVQKCHFSTLKNVKDKMAQGLKSNELASRLKEAEKAVEFFNISRKSLNSLWKLLENNEEDHKDIPALLEAYKGFPDKYSERLMEKRHPLIVLEGLDGSGKSTTGIKLAKKLNGIKLSTPPKDLSANFRLKFDEHPYFRAPFYYFSNYVAALEILEVLQTKPVVLDRFWHSTTAFGLAQLKEDYFDILKTTEIPDEDSDVYLWPDDLIKPDAVILLDVCEEVRNERLSKRTTATKQEELLASQVDFRKNVIAAYKKMRNPAVQVVNGNRFFKGVLQEIDEKIQHLF